MSCHPFGGTVAPSELLVGLSATGYRCEGSYNGPGQPANQWAAWERVGALVAPTSGFDLWRHPEPAIERAAATGAQVLSLGVEWARIEPSPGRVDDAALARYAQILEMSRRHGLLPVVALYDIAHPLWLGEELWLTPGAPDRFAAHAARVVAHLKDHCRHWLTVRQPNHVARCGWIAGAHPPGRLGALSDAWTVLDNLASAHVLAYDEIHHLQPDATVAWGTRRAMSYDEGQLMVDLMIAPSLGVERGALDGWVDDRRARHDLAVPPEDLAMLARRWAVGRTSPFGQGRGVRRPSPRRALDVVYRRSTSRAPLDGLWLVWRPAAAQAGDRAPADATALAVWCGSTQVQAPGLPVWVEDGVAVAPGARGTGARESYLRASIHAVCDARAAGAPIAGYVYHCLGPDTEAALSPPPWARAFLAATRSSPSGVGERGPSGRGGRHRAGDFGLFAVGAGAGGDPEWRARDANGERAGDVLGALADRSGAPGGGGPVKA